jgi:hypothetical protein
MFVDGVGSNFDRSALALYSLPGELKREDEGAGRGSATW